ARRASPSLRGRWWRRWAGRRWFGAPKWERDRARWRFAVTCEVIVTSSNEHPEPEKATPPRSPWRGHAPLIGVLACILGVGIVLGDGVGMDAPADDCDGKFDLQSTASHELGHFLGLGEDKENEATTMYYKQRPCEARKRVLSSDDTAAMMNAYSGVPDAKDD